MISWLAPIFVFGLVVFIHELGHFIAAKVFGVYAPRFALGFGPAIVKWRKGETEYRINWLPVGGYVRMASRMDETGSVLEGGAEEGADLPADADPNAMRPFGPKPIPERRWFESKPYIARLIIMLAGVTMNLALGWVINIGLAKGSSHDVTTVVDSVLTDHPAARAGVLVGDSIVAVNGHSVSSWDALLGMVSDSAGKPLDFTLSRNRTIVHLTVEPKLDTLVDEITGKKSITGKVGLVPRLSTHPLPWLGAVRYGTIETERMATLIFTSLGRLATRDIPVSDLGGPVMIAQQSVKAAQDGADSLFTLISLISINLAVFNLLPIPILDGGQIVIQTVEALLRRPLSDRAREYVAGLGLVLIALLFITVTFNDLKRLVVGLMGGH